mgnify:CR=1 FL=1|tara:strand:- start:992 stop:1876 length:885 start_codon:yes stop_codon:yes gene_type:complete
MKIVELFLDDNEESGIEAISIVESPAIESDFIALKSDEVKLAEVDKEKKILMGALLIPNKPIYRKTEGEEYYIYFSKETVLKASQRYLMNGYQGNSTLEHSDNLEGLTLVESWIVEDEVQDKSRKYGLNAPVGTWMGTIKVNNDDVWNDYVKTGKVKGFSIEGFFADKIEAQKMSKEEQEADLLLSKITSIVKGERVELALADDFEKKFNKTNDDDAKIGKQLIDNLRKAEIKYSQISKNYQDLIKQGEKLESSAKELGIDLPAIIKNKILSSKDGVKEAQKLNQAITKMYSIF